MTFGRIQAGVTAMTAPTRFARQLVSQNILDRLNTVEERLEEQIKKREIDYSKRRVTIRSGDIDGPRLRLEILFGTEGGMHLTSDSPTAGKTWSAALVKPEGNRQYLIRAVVTQLHGQPLIGGFSMEWIVAPGWRWSDGLSNYLYDVASSNPMVVTRRAVSPVNTTSGSFKVRILNIYR